MRRGSLRDDESSPDVNEASKPWDATKGQGVLLDTKTRMMYDTNHVFINGESYLAKGADAALMHKLANDRSLGHQALVKASVGAIDLLSDWYSAGWLHIR